MKRNIAISLMLICFVLINCFNCVKVEAAYNSFGAASYADIWALSRNSNYPSFDADCTNFASQAMHEGGTLPFDKQNGWYCEKVLWWWNWGTAWSVADDLYRYLSNSARGTILGRWKYEGQIGFNDYNDVLQPGDILFYDWNSDGRFDHAGVSVGLGYDSTYGRTGNVQDQHTYDRFHAIWHLKPYNVRATTTTIVAIRPK